MQGPRLAGRSYWASQLACLGRRAEGLLLEEFPERSKQHLVKKKGKKERKEREEKVKQFFFVGNQFAPRLPVPVGSRRRSGCSRVELMCAAPPKSCTTWRNRAGNGKAKECYSLRAIFPIKASIPFLLKSLFCRGFHAAFFPTVFCSKCFT